MDVSQLLKPRSFQARVNTLERPRFIDVARLWVQNRDAEPFTSQDMVGLSNRHGYGKQSTRNAILRMEADGIIGRTGVKQYIPGSKKLCIQYMARGVKNNA